MATVLDAPAAVEVDAWALLAGIASGDAAMKVASIDADDPPEPMTREEELELFSGLSSADDRKENFGDGSAKLEDQFFDTDNDENFVDVVFESELQAEAKSKKENKEKKHKSEKKGQEA